jgi:hypothetical protein
MTNSWKIKFTKKIWRVHQNKNQEKRKRQLIGWVMIPGTLVVAVVVAALHYSPLGSKQFDR